MTEQRAVSPSLGSGRPVCAILRRIVVAKSCCNDSAAALTLPADPLDRRSGQRGRADQIAERDSELPALGRTYGDYFALFSDSVKRTRALAGFKPSRNVAIAASSFRRLPIDLTPSPIRSLAVSFAIDILLEKRGRVLLKPQAAYLPPSIWRTTAPEIFSSRPA